MQGWNRIFQLEQPNHKYRQIDDEIEIFVEQMFVDDIFLYVRIFIVPDMNLPLYVMRLLLYLYVCIILTKYV